VTILVTVKNISAQKLKAVGFYTNRSNERGKKLDFN